MSPLLRNLMVMAMLAALVLPPGQARSGETNTTSSANCLHGVSKDICFICDASLREKGRLWCKGHNRYEDRCWACHPDLRDPKRDFCDSHGLYEDECFFCNPALKAKPAAPAATAPAVPPAAKPRLMCKGHNVYEDECGICHPDLAGTIEPERFLKIRLASPQAAAKAGIKTATPLAGSAAAGVEGFAEIQFNQNKLAHITAPAGGIMQEVEVDLGSSVTGGMVVARIFSADYQRAMAELPVLQQAVERERKLRTAGISSKKELDEAEAALHAAMGVMRQFNPAGFDPSTRPAKPDETAFLELRAPFAGNVIERNAVRGASVDQGKPLLVICDCSTMWATVSIPESELPRISIGQSIELTADALPGRSFTGTLTWIAPQVDEHTRLARARAELPNPDGLLRARMFASARIQTGPAGKVALVPPAALQQINGKPFIFVKKEDDLFEARPVLPGARHDGLLEIFAGITTDDQVVTSGGFLVKSQMLISRLGAGCCPE